MTHPPRSDDGPHEFAAVVFDAYGTLFDFASAVMACADQLGDRVGPLATLWRDRQLQYSWLRALQGRYVPFWQVTGEALDHALEALGLDGDPVLRQRLMDLHFQLGAYPETGAVVRALCARGLKLAVLSNGSPEMLAAAVANAQLGNVLDPLLSVHDVATFKPDPRVYRLAVERLGLAAGEILFVSANAWDAHAAAAFGMRAVWCNRSGAAAERLPGEPFLQVRSLNGLLDVVRP